MILGLLAVTNLPLLSISSQTIDRVTSFKLLGVHIGSSLSWSIHIDQTFPKVHTRTQRYCSFIQFGLNHYQHKTNKSCNSYFIIVCPHPRWLCLCYCCNDSCICYPMSLTHLCFIVLYCALLCFYHCILRTVVLVYSAPQPQECLINLLTWWSLLLHSIVWKDSSPK